MTARDDYPVLERAATARQLYTQAEKDEMACALNEIDNLRADVSKLLTMLADAGVGWPERVA